MVPSHLIALRQSMRLIPLSGLAACHADSFASYEFSSSELKEFLLTKLHNGLIRANAVPPLDRLFRVPRREALNDFMYEDLFVLLVLTDLLF